MARPEGIQLPLLVEFGGQPADDPIFTARAAFNPLYPGQEGQSRFVRLVQEEVVIHSPGDAAVHLLNRVYTPFDQFDQEELWTLLLNTHNRVTHEVMVYRGVRRITTSHYRVDTTLWEGARNPQVQPT